MLFIPFSIAITSLGEERAILSAFRTFVRFVLVWICRFPLPLGVWEGLRFVIVALPGLFSYLFLQWERWKQVFFYLIEDILTKVLNKCTLYIFKSLLLRSHEGVWTWNFQEMFIALASTKLCFYCHCSYASLIWQQSFHRRIMGKVKAGNLSVLPQIFSQKFNKTVSLLPNIWILSKQLNLIGCHGNQRCIKIFKK